METERAPAQVFPLASFLGEEMEARGWTTDDVARRMKTRRPAYDALVLMLILAVHEDNLIIDDDTFKALARAFDVSEDYFRNLDAVWRKWPDRRVPYEMPDSLVGPVSRMAFPAERDRP